jgi:hypothetical protein
MFRYQPRTYDRHGRLLDEFDFMAPDDDEAYCVLDDFPEEASYELWCGKRWIQTRPASQALKAADREKRVS